MITDKYAALLKENHALADPAKPWGRSGAKNFGDRVVTLLNKRPQIKTVLDFGAGQLTMQKYVQDRVDGLVWTNYDPGIPGIDELPTGYFDLIISSDVMEHVEPDHVGHVINWLHAHSKLFQYHLIACDPCKSVLPDGRNAHLSVHEPSWWHRQFLGQGTIVYFSDEKVMKRSIQRSYCCLLIDK